MAFGSIFADADVGPVTGSAGAGTSLAFGPASSSPSGAHPLDPAASGFALAFWLGVTGFVALIAIRRALPA